MEGKNITREEALKRFREAKERKRAFLAEMEASMRQSYRQRTGMEATSFNVW